VVPHLAYPDAKKSAASAVKAAGLFRDRPTFALVIGTYRRQRGPARAPFSAARWPTRAQWPVSPTGEPIRRSISSCTHSGPVVLALSLPRNPSGAAVFDPVRFCSDDPWRRGHTHPRRCRRPAHGGVSLHSSIVMRGLPIVRSERWPTPSAIRHRRDPEPDRADSRRSTSPPRCSCSWCCASSRRIVGFSILKFHGRPQGTTPDRARYVIVGIALPSLMKRSRGLAAPQPVVGLVVPTGYSFNLDGTNYMTLATCFIAQALVFDLTFGT